jgi:hypothetical protein
MQCASPCPRRTPYPVPLYPPTSREPSLIPGRREPERQSPRVLLFQPRCLPSQVCRKWSTPPTSPTSVAISDLGAERFPTLLLNHKKLPESVFEGDGDRDDPISPRLEASKAETLPVEMAEMASVVLPLPTSWVGRMLAGWC